ncbi:MAG: transglycosylase SLT domain-containing protein [Methyloversatilis sp.]|uniref:transglycosylase SLT domain-containing protein n=1 Tax=Methyloversatilis TaxID=378210 RepID=UPI00199F4BA6|nr:transglycosylase SLT domain-containing protein [Methyloversatilis discipulorum]MBC7205798.1 transglycosylase SLT domain-containing protein [Methyloversatilis sp.]MBT9518278.1 transglycosylase SLT domain-containing protein [Methyloversatilis discipulorum]
MKPVRLALLIACCASAPVLALEPEAAARSLLAEARSFEHGEGVRRDTARAAALYCQAAKLGDAEAQFNLAWMYANGRGVERDDALAATFFDLAARQGHEHAQRMLRFTGAPTRELPLCMQDPPEPEPVMTADIDPDLEAAFGTTADRKRVIEIVRELAPHFDIDPQLVLAVIGTESNFNPKARSPKNAQGLMQLIPETAQRFNVRDTFDPVQNIRGGMAYLRWLLAYFEGDVVLATAGYNAGEGAVDRYKGVPPYRETREYVKRIQTLFRKTEHRYDQNVTTPSPVLRTLVSRRG